MTRYKSHLAGNSLGSRLMYSTVRNILTVWLRVWCREAIEGRENIPVSGPFILAPVHRSILDTPISSTLTRRRLRFMGKDSMWRTKFGNWFLSALGAFPVSRGTADREALKRCIQVLQGGEPLVLFPEGERKAGPIVRPLFDGAAYVAVKAGVPIVPVGIGGSERVMPKGSRFIYPRKLVVVIGKPIEVPTDGSGRAPRAIVREITEQLHESLQQLLDSAQVRAG
ncbi:MAG: lysophospholipid acyltransferase family protein [Ilumatobacteraceae bacterium]